MDHRTRTLKELETHAGRTGSLRALAGLDGFVDTIVHPVAQRHGPGNNFTAMATIPEFAARVAGAAGKSTNIELFPLMQKPGGNGPILAGALLAAGVRTRYIGALGRPGIHPIFADFAARTEAVSVAEAAATTAVECTDGKIMLGNTASLDAISYESVIAAMGEGAFLDAISRVDAIALVNWTMIPHMTEFFVAVLDRVIPMMPPRDHRLWFFDLADPEKRSRGDLVHALRTMARFQPHGTVTLGLNFKEAQQVAAALDLPSSDADEKGLCEMAREIRQALGVGAVVVHPRDAAACATRDGAWWVPGPYTEKPLITTGAGDHFNAGFVCGQLLGLTPEACLTVGVCFSGLYVRTARSPSLIEVDGFLRSW
jgi:sugar/nucleoside kinase (ribokinase family)